MSARASTPQHSLTDAQRKAIVDRVAYGRGAADRNEVQRTVDAMSRAMAANSRGARVQRRIDQNNEALRMAALDRAVEKQPHAFTSGASPSVGEAPASPLVGASTSSARKAA